MYRGNEWRREEVRSRQNKLIENEALAEVQLAAFPWESLSLSLSLSLRLSLENERGGEGGHAFFETPWFLGRENSKERGRNPCVKTYLTFQRGGGRGAWPITDGRAEKQSYPLREAGHARERASVGRARIA